MKARSRLGLDTDLQAPHLLDLEVMSVIRRAARAGQIDQRRAGLALRDLSELQITRYPHVEFAPRIWELRDNVTVYDAAYIALAENLGCVFVTADRALTRLAGLECEVELLESPRLA